MTRSSTEFTIEQRDRIAGVLVGAACGDALGVPYEFATPLGPEQVPEMIGGGLGPYRPAEWSDDTQMAACIALVAAEGRDLSDEEALDGIARRFVAWRTGGASDIGAQTRQVLAAAQRHGGPTAAALRAASAEVHERTGRSAGNGSLMRTAVVALPYLDQPGPAGATATVEAARAVSTLTHHDPLAGDACVLWCSGIRHAVLDGTFDGVREGLALLPDDRRGDWERWLTEAEWFPPGRFNPNGFVVPALQAAWSAIVHTEQAPGHLEESLATAVRIGNDTDTVAAIAGALLGARWGLGAVPPEWRERVHGWPGLTATDLADLALRAARAAHLQ